jgi:hypothetical protein
VAADAITLARLASTSPHTSAIGSAPQPSETEEAEDFLIADKLGHGSPLGRVLRLPSREV